MIRRAALFACGNPSRGDDGLGPALLARAEAFLARRSSARVELIQDFQLQIEHVLDLHDADLALFLDAGVAVAPPYRFTRLVPAADPGFSSHRLTPAALLHLHGRTLGEPPPSFLLCVRGESFGLGDPIGPVAAGHLEAAWTFLARLLERMGPRVWAAQAARHA